MDVSVVIPCHRSPQVLQKLVIDLVGVLTEAELSFEVILVLDSQDNSTQELTIKIMTHSERIRRVSLSKNFGQQAATAAGIAESTGDIIVTLDDDYQHSPLDALAIVKILQGEPALHLVYGLPSAHHQSFGRRLSGRIFRRLMTAAGIPYFDLFSPLRAFRGNFRGAISTYSGPQMAVDVALSWVVSEVRGHPATFFPRTDGHSGYSAFARLRLALSFLFTQSTTALQWGIYLGLLGVFSAFALGIRIFHQYLTDELFVAGFATTILVILSVGSIQLLLLGIMGKYVGLQHYRGLGKPAYYVSSRD